MWQDRKHCSVVSKRRQQKIHAIDGDDSENVEEATDNMEDLQALCLSEESENEQWEEVVSRRDKQTVKKANEASLLSLETCLQTRDAHVHDHSLLSAPLCRY